MKCLKQTRPLFITTCVVYLYFPSCCFLSQLSFHRSHCFGLVSRLPTDLDHHGHGCSRHVSLLSPIFNRHPTWQVLAEKGRTVRSCREKRRCKYYCYCTPTLAPIFLAQAQRHNAHQCVCQHNHHRTRWRDSTFSQLPFGLRRARKCSRSLCRRRC